MHKLRQRLRLHPRSLQHSARLQKLPKKVLAAGKVIASNIYANYEPAPCLMSFCTRSAPGAFFPQKNFICTWRHWLRVSRGEVCKVVQCTEHYLRLNGDVEWLSGDGERNKFSLKAPSFARNGIRVFGLSAVEHERAQRALPHLLTAIFSPKTIVSAHFKDFVSIQGFFVGKAIPECVASPSKHADGFARIYDTCSSHSSVTLLISINFCRAHGAAFQIHFPLESFQSAGARDGSHRTMSSRSFYAHSRWSS